MPKRKAIIIPDWLTAVMRDNRLEGSIYQYAPAYMHWKSAYKIVSAIEATTASNAVHVQLRELLADIQKQLQINNNNDYSLVACFEYPRNIPFTVIVNIAEDVKKPAVTHHVVLRLFRNGYIKDVERVYNLESGKKS